MKAAQGITTELFGQDGMAKQLCGDALRRFHREIRLCKNDQLGVRMHVDKTRTDDHAACLNDLPYWREVWGNLGNPAIPYQHIRNKTRRACAVNHGAMLHGIVHGAFPLSPLTTQRIALELGGGANVQRLNNARVDCGYDVYSSV